MRAIRVGTFGGIENLKLESNVAFPSVGKKEVRFQHSKITIYVYDLDILYFQSPVEWDRKLKLFRI